MRFPLTRLFRFAQKSTSPRWGEVGVLRSSAPGEGAQALPLQPPVQLRLAPGALRRAALAGSAWGLATSAGLIGLRFWQCGVVCLDDVAATTILAVGAGLLTIGPLAAFGRTHAER